MEPEWLHYLITFQLKCFGLFKMATPFIHSKGRFVLQGASIVAEASFPECEGQGWAA